jgi:hypothetical protein
LRYLAYAGIVALLLLAVLAWLMSSFARGRRRRDRRILELLAPVGRRLERSEPVDPAEVRALAAMPLARGMLYQLLKHFGRVADFPEELMTRRHHAESMLVYWMMHPNELDDPPAEIELAETISRPVGDREGEFLVFRYRMPEGHWASSDWLLGVAGPFFPNDIPYADDEAGAYTVCTDKAAAVTPDEIVERFAERWVLQTARTVRDADR